MATIKSGTFIALAQTSQTLFTKIKKADQIKANNDWFALTFNRLNDGGYAISPDKSYPTLLKDEKRNGWVVA